MIFYRRADPLCFPSGAASAVTDAATFQTSFNALAFNVAAAAIEVTILPGSIHWAATKSGGRGDRQDGLRHPPVPSGSGGGSCGDCYCGDGSRHFCDRNSGVELGIPYDQGSAQYFMLSEEFEEKYEEFENKIWRNTSIHSVIPPFTMNESINK